MKKGKRLFALLLCMVMLVAALPLTASAASYPLIMALSTESSQTIPEGETGLIRFMIFPEFHNEKYNVEVYDSTGTKVATASSTYYNSDGTYVKYVNITIDTDDLDMGVGTYTVKYWSSFYSLYSWHDAPNQYTYTFKVIKNTCKGNHNLVVDRVVSEGTCEEEGTVKVHCTKCEYEAYEQRLGDHTYGNCTQDTASAHKYSCTVCGAAKSEAHSWDTGTVTYPTLKANGYTTFTCTGCGYSYAENYTFPDVRSSYWGYNAVEFAVAKGYFSGYKSGNFGPSDSITRQDFVVVLARIAGVDLSKYAGPTEFPDVQKGSYYEAAVKWASSTGVVMGYKNGKFGVGDKITREQLVTILYRFAQKRGYSTSVPSSAADKFNEYTDTNKVNSYAKTAVTWALHKGIIGGMTPTTIGPEKFASRGQVATILMNISKKGIMPI